MQKNKNKYIRKNKKTNKGKAVIAILMLIIIIGIGAVFFTKIIIKRLKFQKLEIIVLVKKL